MADVADITKLLSEAKVQQLNDVNFSSKGLKLDSEEDAKEIVKAIRNCKDLQALHLGGNTIGVEAAKAIADALETHKEFERAYWGDMFTSRLRSEIPPALRSLGGAVIVAQASLVELDLSDNAFGPDGIKAVTDLLVSKPGHTIQILKLNNNGLGPNGGKILATALLDCYKNSDGKFALKSFVCGRNRLEVLGSTSLASAFKTIGTLEDVSMPQNGIKSEGIVPLVSALASNKFLKRLNLNDNIFSEDGSKALAEAMTNWPLLEYINFGDCLLRSDGARAIASTIEGHNTKLQEVLLDSNEIDTSAALVLINALKSCSFLRKLDLNSNCFGSEGIELIKKAIEGSCIDDSLGSFSDDEILLEEAGDEDEDDDKDENDVSKDDTTGELVEDDELQIKGISVTPESSPRSVDKCQERFNYDKIVCKFLTISEPFIKTDDQLPANIIQDIDEMMSKVFTASEFNYEIFVTVLLTYMGLLKSEDKTFKPKIDNLNGPINALRHTVKQTYFPKEVVPVLRAFMTKPNQRLENCNASKHLLMQALYQV